MYRVTKTYDHNLGLSTAFRQWKADSHCNLIHGYALAFKLTFEGDELDHRNWLIGFGDLKPIKQWLQHMFDHTLCIAFDDPEFETFKLLKDKKLADIRFVPATGCEAFAKMVYDEVSKLDTDRVKLVEVEVREHAGNSAIYKVK